MRVEDFDQFRELMAEVYAFYRQDLSGFVLDIWWQAMKQFDLDTLRNALGQHCMNPDTGQFCPKPADVMRMLGGTTKDAALLAWARVERAVSEHGSWATVVFDDPIIHKAIEDLGGWVQLCTQGQEEWPFVEKRFCDYYRAYRTRGVLPPYPPKLVGRTDLGNVERGLPAMQPALIGDAAKCQAVLEDGGGQQQQKLLTKRVA